MFSASTSLRTAQVANFVRTPAKSRSTKVCSSRCLSRGKCWFFSFLVFLWAKRKGVKFGGQMECVVHSSFTSRVEEMDARWTNRSFLSRNIFVEKMCAKKEILSRLSRFAKRVSHARAKRIKSFGWKGKKRVKTSKRGCFLVSLIHFFSHKKNKFLTKFSLMCTPLNTDCKVHGVHGWKPRLR